MTVTPTQLQSEFVESFGNLYAAYGWKRLDGLIIGLLLARACTMSLDEICAALGRSKGPISESVRQLAAKGLVRKMAGGENRRDYYAIDPEVFHHNHLLNMQTVRRNRAIAEQFLARQHGEAELEGMRRNLRRMLAFYTLMEQFYHDFSAQWTVEHTRVDQRSNT
ncbi:MAG: winged helix DNA-binding protein [Bacteroidota bacterium]|jgi:DNA-binding transcriptional regulator GbsR (MarR family)|nr:winged helix DNA-binding protein [Bacteroidota bacterium]